MSDLMFMSEDLKTSCPKSLYAGTPNFENLPGIVILYLWGDSSQSPTYPITPTVGEYNFNPPPCCN